MRPVARASSFFANRAYIDLYGGALVFGGGDACRAGAQMQADQHGARCYGVDYRTPPEHPFPAALDDCPMAYRYALDRHGPADIIIGGRSAGGNLAVATLLRARAEALPMPAALVRASALLLLVPPLAALEAWLLFGEWLVPVQFAGFALALGGVVLARTRKVESLAASAGLGEANG